MSGFFVVVFGDRPLALRHQLAAMSGPGSTLQTAIENEQSHLLCSRDLEMRALGDGIIIGSLFTKSGEAVRELSPTQVHSIIASRGVTLVDEFWGSYIAVWRDPDGTRHHILRGPTGTLPAYLIETNGVCAWSNQVGSLVQIGLLKKRPDWPAIVTHLRNGHLRLPRTAIADVTELVGGVRCTWAHGSQHETVLWSPWDFAERQNEIGELYAAVALVATTTRQSVAALCSRQRKVLIGVSGGLDSSIVAACLAEAAVPTAVFTLVSDDAGGDERRYAYPLARHLGLDLIELHEDRRLVEVRRSDAAGLPRPVARAFAQSGDRLQQDLASAVSADAYFTGAGGDNVFAYIPSVSPVSDRLRREGLGMGALESARDISALTGVGAPKILLGAMRRAWFRKPAYRWPADDSMLTAKAKLMGLDPMTHPWLSPPDGALPGKAAHIAWLVGIQNHLEGFARERERPLIAPLMAQPLVEACLRIPTWLWSSGGQNRAIARLAFQSALPAEILARRNKGTPDGYLIAVFEAHRRAITEMLMDGALVREGVVDHRQVGAIVSQRLVNHAHCDRLMRLTDVEAWLGAL